MAVAQRQCSGDLSSLLVPWLAWLEIFRLSDNNSVCDSVLVPGGFEISDASRTLSLINANLGSKDLQSEVTVVAKKNLKRHGCPVAGRSGALLGSGTGEHERQGWSLEVLDTSFVPGECQKSENPQGGAQPGGYRWEQRPGAVVETGENAGRKEW